MIAQVDSRDWALNGNTISLDEDTVIDVPQPFDQTERYCASLGHKANHSFTPNCKYDPWVQNSITEGGTDFKRMKLNELWGKHSSLLSWGDKGEGEKQMPFTSVIVKR